MHRLFRLSGVATGAAIGVAVLLAGCSSSGGNSAGGATVAAPPLGSSASSSSPGAGASSSSGALNVPGYTNPESPAAKAITGIVYKPEPDHNHVEGTIIYDSSPPIGGNHSQYWADCSGTVYPDAIANENAVHSLEHGAVWITYQPGLPSDQIATLTKQVAGVDRMLMSPYPGLKSAVSLQSWDYQLFVDSASDPRIAAFIGALRFNPNTTPESAATCSQPTFISAPSTFGHPLWAPTI
jgi:hypothetical protein